MLADLLPHLSVPYFRFNPLVPAMALDETSPAILSELQATGRKHVLEGGGKAQVEALARLLLARDRQPGLLAGPAALVGRIWAGIRGRPQDSEGGWRSRL